VDSADFDVPWLLEQMKDVPKEQRSARFVCQICYIDEQGERLIRGQCEGQIGFEEVGEGGFGYDPIFMTGNKSFAELDSDEKNAISHRGIALRKLVEELK
jgi:XTP/dITP diphosphohydrolase